MSTEQLRQDVTIRQAGRSNGNVQILRQMTDRLAEVREGRSRLKPKDLVDLLLCHGARAWRASLPVSRSRVRAIGPSGGAAIRLRIG